jgi:acetolactate synthase regulatory subunit
MEQFELIVNSKEHVTLLTKVLMMFSRRRVNVLTVNSESNRWNSLYRIRFSSGADEAHKLQRQVQKAVDIIDARLVRVDALEPVRHPERVPSHQLQANLY